MIGELNRIICIGNRFVQSDDIGPRVHDCLARRILPEDVSLIDGGLMGLDLLRFLGGTRRVVFVDTLAGFSQPGRIVVLDHHTALAGQTAPYGHGGGLAFLLHMLPAVCGRELPEIALVGAAWPVAPDVVERLADTALSIAVGEKHERGRDTGVDIA